MLRNRLVQPHPPPKHIPALIELPGKCPEPRQDQIRITRRLAQHIRALLMLVQNRDDLLDARLRLLPRRLAGLLALRQLVERHPEPHRARPLEVLRARRVQQQFGDARDADRREGAADVEDGFLRALDEPAVEAQRGLGLQGFEGVGDAARVHHEGPVGHLDHWAGVAAGRSVCCGGDAEGGEFGGHVRVFDPGGFVGDALEVEGCAGWRIC